MWPASPSELIAAQHELARSRPEPWSRGGGPLLVAACFVCFARGGAGRGRAGDPGWAAAVVLRSGRSVAGSALVRGVGGAPYAPGLLALREGPLLEAAVRALPAVPDVLLVNASGRDHPRGAGLALELGAVLELPTVGVTDRPLLAAGADPAPDRGATSPLRIDGVEVARWLRTRAGARPVAVHPGWRTDLDTAIAVVRAATRRARTPEPLRRARREARAARAADTAQDP